jgi:hypothetical protein
VPASRTVTVTLPMDEQTLIARPFDAPPHLVVEARSLPRAASARAGR